MHLSSTRVTFRKLEARGTCCISGQHLKLRTTSRSISMSASAYRRRPSIISWALDIRSASRRSQARSKDSKSRPPPQRSIRTPPRRPPRPIQQDAQRLNVFRLHIPIHQKALSILRHVISKNIGARNRSAPLNLEQRNRRSGSESTLSIYWHRRQHAAGINVVNLFAISAPARLGSSPALHFPFPRGARKRRYIDFPRARVIGGIRHPVPIRRDLAVCLAALAVAVQKPARFSASNGQQFQMGA